MTVTESRIRSVKYGFQSMPELFVKRDTYSYEMDSGRSLENVGGNRAKGLLWERSEEANDDSSSEGSWPEPVTKDEVEEEEDVELPLPTMGVPPLEENDEPYPDPWIGVMDMDVTYRNTMLVKDKYHIQVSYSRAWRARNKALVAVFGGWDESYNLLPQFLKAIKDTNRGTKYKTITTDDGVREGNFVRFDRVFWAFGPAIHGFQFCRPFISVDGTHLYGKYKGYLLIATSFDGDNRLFPLAFALVETENIDTWTWFISCLARHVVRGRSPMCIISDRHSGIIESKKGCLSTPHRHKVQIMTHRCQTEEAVQCQGLE
ncbi:hypothetical protein H6P81_003391 [Aristolochia fimbriata]|uniref:MULE transposase domain-containing protein n=1 Tax=Aristolochia fimbriata TaxID=158543 RepID=A0AAV7FGS5_ARIFI|nr:hypothetical protein H6P81_003391 [Aristolochia fimbriata]